MPNGEPERGDTVYDRGGSIVSTVKRTLGYIDRDNTWKIEDCDDDVLSVRRYKDGWVVV